MADTSTASFILKGSQNRNSSRAGTGTQGLMQRPQKRAAYWFSPLTSHSLLSCTVRTTCPGMTQPHNGFGPPPSVTNEENALQTYPRPDLKEAFFHLRLSPLRSL